MRWLRPWNFDWTACELVRLLWFSRKLFPAWVCFTDGACENKTSMGAVLIGPAGYAFGYFGVEFQEDLRAQFFSEAKHPIYEVELSLVVMMFW